MLLSGEKPDANRKETDCMQHTVLSIGIAAIVPLEYLMAAQAQPNDSIQTLAAEPLFDVKATYVNCNPNFSGGNSTTTVYGPQLMPYST
jgi:hypothetical protein